MTDFENVNIVGESILGGLFLIFTKFVLWYKLGALL